ncbi:MAG: helix-turn-helix domain-containing protein [Aureispira sp.]
MADLDEFTQKNIEQIAQRIRTLRKERGYSNQEKFAYEIDIARAQYGRYERGIDLKISSLSKILFAHGITLQEFFAAGFEDVEQKEEL